MQHRLDSFRLAGHHDRRQSMWQRREIANRKVALRALLATWATLAVMAIIVGMAAAQELEPLPGFEPDAMDHGAPSEMHFGAGDFFSQDLGTVLRVRYNTESYGQNDHGNLDLGTFQAINFADSIAFVDGQVTLNDVQGVGFNIGVGYRWMSIMPNALESERISGVSIWADGTSTRADNFFPQVGVSFESLGELWDLRANGYIPVGDDEQVGDFVPTGEIDFQSFFLSQITEAVVDQSFTAAELEVARRLGRQRDAWAFAGPYFLTNDFDDTVGYEVGLRGYAYPDLLLQFAVTEDDIFHTNATFSLVWFVGRTRTNFQPTCGVPDRFREPVMRNDYVVLTQSRAASGIPLTDPDGNNIRIVHVDSTAPDGGNGTFESPLNDLADIQPNSQPGDIILAHAQSMFDMQAPATLQADQRFLGEGEGFVHTVVTAEEGMIDIPETAPGARNATRPLIIDALTDAIVLANDNEVANFDIEGGDNAISGVGLTANGNLHDLEIRDTMANAIELSTISGDFTITEVSVMNGDAFAIALTDFMSAGSVTLDEFTYNGGTGTAGGIRFSNYDGTFTASDSMLMNGTSSGVEIMGPSDGTFTFQNTVTFTSVDGRTFFIDGGAADEFTGVVTVSGAITNDTGRSVEIRGLSGGTDEPTVTFSGNITDTGQGIFVDNNAGGTTLFSGNLTMNTMANDAITVTNNAAAADISFGGILNIDTTTGDGFIATSGGNLAVSGFSNTIDKTAGGGAGLTITDVTIANAGVNFERVTVNGAATAIRLEDLTGGPVAIGEAAGGANSGGTLNTTGPAIVLSNVRNVDLRQMFVQSAGGNGVTITHDSSATTAMDVLIDNLNLDAATGTGIAVTADNDANNFGMRLTNGDLESNVVMTATGSGTFQLLVESTDITTTGTEEAFVLTFADTVANADVTIRNDNNFISQDASALFIDSTGNSAKTVDLLIEDSDFINDSAASAAADIQSRGNTTLNATIQGNIFDKGMAGGDDFDLTGDGASARVRLLLGSVDVEADQNTAAGVGSFRLRELNGADFDIFERDATIVTDTKNNGAVNTTPNDAAFENLPSPPPTPALPPP